MARDKEKAKLATKAYYLSEHGRALRKLASEAREQRRSDYSVEGLVVNAEPLTKGLAAWRPLAA